MLSQNIKALSKLPNLLIMFFFFYYSTASAAFLVLLIIINWYIASHIINVKIMMKCIFLLSEICVLDDTKYLNVFLVLNYYKNCV